MEQLYGTFSFNMPGSLQVARPNLPHCPPWIHRTSRTARPGPTELSVLPALDMILRDGMNSGLSLLERNAQQRGSWRARRTGSGSCGACGGWRSCGRRCWARRRRRCPSWTERPATPPTPRWRPGPATPPASCPRREGTRCRPPRPSSSTTAFHLTSRPYNKCPYVHVPSVDPDRAWHLQLKCGSWMFLCILSRFSIGGGVRDV